MSRVVTRSQSPQKKASPTRAESPKKKAANSPKRKAKPTKRGDGTKTSLSTKANITMSVSRVARNMKHRGVSKRVGLLGAVRLAAVLDSLASNVLLSSCEIVAEKKRQTIKPHHIQLAIGRDEDLKHLLSGVNIIDGGVTPHIHKVLTVKGKKRKQMNDHEVYDAYVRPSKKTTETGQTPKKKTKTPAKKTPAKKTPAKGKRKAKK